MAPKQAIYIAYTGVINPSGATPVLTHEQVWAGLESKVDHAEGFVSAIISTDVVSKSEDEYGRKVTSREVVFREGNKRMPEEVIHYQPFKVLFVQPNGSRVQNIISTGANGELFLTYDFEWVHSGLSDAEVEAQKEKYRTMSKTAVESSIDAIREMVKSGQLK